MIIITEKEFLQMQHTLSNTNIEVKLKVQNAKDVGIVYPSLGAIIVIKNSETGEVGHSLTIDDFPEYFL